MPSRSWFPGIALVLVSLLLAVGNLWFAGGRSLIPAKLETSVVELHHLTEKNPGVDDVYLLDLANDETVQVDQRVFDPLKTGDSISKERWASEVQVSGNTVELDWSDDVRGMIWVMPVGVGLLVLQVLFLRRRVRHKQKAP